MDGARTPTAVTNDGSVPAVGFFEQLYAIIVGLGLAFAAQQIIDLDRGTVPIAWEHVPVFLAYLILGVALAHAGVRYSQLVYDRQLLGPLTKARVVSDVVTGVSHFLFLIGLSLVITRPIVFVYFAMILLAGRLLREVMLRVLREKTTAFDARIALINLITIVLFGIVLAVDAMLSGEIWVVRSAVMVISMFYGLGLYIGAFEYFFGGRAQELPTV